MDRISDRCCSDASPRLHSRRSMIVAGASSVLLAAKPLAAATADASPDDERFMRLALEEARHGDYPFGAVIVPQI